ncbi:FAS1-like dehydratase domain-containing protein [Cryptosporangium aurantiacum]|uniref:3-methylfumaryl-CoA hydratase n=1 Tax=Cryptosporangium aurantiacum TaxID=134849 RepID=A0A1M7P8C4_9ACTN|nr:hypothetical protein [Cryptosporangium aurantiacum]SHN12910.1 3-methylfumaryl-CoA hydratase [Cryptosporangium aurantiacum]
MELREIPGAWKPEPVEDEQVLDPAAGAAAAGLWNQPPPGEHVPPLWHWFHFLDWPPHSALGADGHPRVGVFLPPVDDRRRMFAGGRWTRERPLRYGVATQRRRALVSTRTTSGRTGELLFVTVLTELSQDGRTCVSEEQDLVYRSGPSAVDLRGTPLATTAPAEDGLRLHPDATLLFRMSALTGNHHRIHYDHPYAVGVEHYPGLVVHGPLLVLHLAETLRRASSPTPDALEFRLHAPAFAGEPLVAATGPEPGALRLASGRNAAHVTAAARWRTAAGVAATVRP